MNQEAAARKTYKQNFYFKTGSVRDIRVRTEQNPQEQKERIKSYWAERSHDFAALREKELSAEIAHRWSEELAACLPKTGGARALDVGTGGGFFAFLLNDFGYETTGIDLTPKMIAEAERIGKGLNSNARFLVMDAEKPAFADESFDLIVSHS